MLCYVMQSFWSTTGTVCILCRKPDRCVSFTKNNLAAFRQQLLKVPLKTDPQGDLRREKLWAGRTNGPCVKIKSILHSHWWNYVEKD